MNAGRKILAIIAMSIILFPALGSAQDDSWILSRDRKGIKIYTKKIPGSNFKASRAEMEIKTPLQSLVALMTDFSSFTEWYPRMKEVTCLKELNQFEYYIYLVIDSPWPVKDRDSVNHFILSQDPRDKSITIEFNDISDYIPEKPGLIRVKKIHGLWKLIPLDNGMVRVIYETESDPGGKLPPWLINLTCVDRPYKIFQKIQKTVALDKYQHTICGVCKQLEFCN